MTLPGPDHSCQRPPSHSGSDPECDAERNAYDPRVADDVILTDGATDLANVTIHRARIALTTVPRRSPAEAIPGRNRGPGG